MWESPPPPITQETPTVRDRRVRPSGVLPRSIQVWVMAGLALVILGIIVMTGSPTPPERRSTEAEPEATRPVSPARVESYQQTVDQRTRLLQEELARLHEQASALPAEPVSPDAYGAATAPEDPLRDEQRRREYQSLFAEVVVHSRRAERDRPSMQTAVTVNASPAPYAMLPTATRLPAAVPASLTGAESPAVATASNETPPAAVRPAAKGPTPPLPLTGETHTLLEGTLIETVLTNRLDGTFAGPVIVMVTTPVLAHGGQTVIIPAGARLLGAASPVSGWGDARLAVRFHRLLQPNGRTFSLDQFQGLNQRGDTGLKDQVNRHYLQVFGASLAIGAISGLAQFNTRSGYDQTFEDAYRQGVGASLANTSARVLDRFLNQLPTITIREGHRIKVYLTSDLTLPAWNDGRDRRPFLPTGGAR